MQEIDKRIALIRLLLADVDGRIAQQAETQSQYQVQIARIVEATIRQAGDVGQALTAMAEVQERLVGIETTGRHLAQLRQRAARELEALLLTKRVAEATVQLAELEGRRQALAGQLAALDHAAPAGAESTPGTGPAAPDMAEARELRDLNEQVSHEIARLHNLISEASRRAARSISTGA